jgi:hypothetical protein
VADILMLLALDQSRAHRERGVKAFECLDAALLVGTHQMNPLFAQWERLSVMLTNSPNLRVEDLRLGWALVV